MRYALAFLAGFIITFGVVGYFSLALDISGDVDYGQALTLAFWFAPIVGIFTAFGLSVYDEDHKK